MTTWATGTWIISGRRMMCYNNKNDLRCDASIILPTNIPFSDVILVNKHKIIYQFLLRKCNNYLHLVKQYLGFFKNITESNSMERSRSTPHLIVFAHHICFLLSYTIDQQVMHDKLSINEGKETANNIKERQGTDPQDNTKYLITVAQTLTQTVDAYGSSGLIPLQPSAVAKVSRPKPIKNIHCEQ